ncbi:MAG: hypothetical protein V1804_00785 [Patescibacteria group bacterium]
MVKTLFIGRQIRSSNPLKSGVMREVMKNDKIRGVLNKSSKQKQFLDALKKRSGEDSVSKDEFRQALGDLMTNKNDAISKSGVIEIGRAMKDKLGKKRYIISKETSNITNSKNIQKTSFNLPPLNTKNTVSNRQPSNVISLKNYQGSSFNKSAINNPPSKAPRMQPRRVSQSALDLLSEIQDKKTA